MHKSFKEILKEAKYTSVSNLNDTVWSAILVKQKKHNTILILGYSLIGVFSLLGLVIVVKDIFTQFTQSGFYDYISLASSDMAIVTTYWKEFALSLTESLPVASITISLFLLFIMFISLRKVIYQYKYQLLTA